VLHSTVVCGDSLSIYLFIQLLSRYIKYIGTYSVLRELRNVVKNELVGVTQLVQLLLIGVGHDTTDDLGDGVIKLGVTTEFLPLLSVLMLISHFSNIVVTRIR